MNSNLKSELIMSNKKKYEKPEVKGLSMEDIMEQDGVGIGVHPSIEDNEDGGAKENPWAEDEEADTTTSLWETY